jgi:hypothetical protein
VDSLSRTGPGDAVQPQSNGTGPLRRRSFASSSRGGCAALTQRHRAAPSMQLHFVQPERRRSLDPTVLGRSADTAPFRLTEAASIASLSMLRLGAAASTGWCCSLELAQSKKASLTKPTLFSCFLTATRHCRSLELVQSKKASHAKPIDFYYRSKRTRRRCDPATDSGAGVRVE